MSILELLGLKKPSIKTESPGIENEVLEDIAKELSSLDHQEALRAAAFAYLLSRVAYADREVSEAERIRMSKILQDEAGLSPERAQTVGKMATQKAKLFGAVQDYLITREFNKIASHKDKKSLLSAVFSVAAADGIITGAESRELRQIAAELKLDREDYTKLRVAYSDKLEENK